VVILPSPDCLPGGGGAQRAGQTPPPPVDSSLLSMKSPPRADSSPPLPYTARAPDYIDDLPLRVSSWTPEIVFNHLLTLTLQPATRPGNR